MIMNTTVVCTIIAKHVLPPRKTPILHAYMLWSITSLEILSSRPASVVRKWQQPDLSLSTPLSSHADLADRVQCKGIWATIAQIL